MLLDGFTTWINFINYSISYNLLLEFFIKEKLTEDNFFILQDFLSFINDDFTI